MTPEGKVKAKVDKLLKSYGADMYFFKPVQSRWGTKTLDYLCCHRERFFAIETKVNGEDLTKYQQNTRDEIIAAGGVVFRVSNEEELLVLENWLTSYYDGFV